MAESLGKAVLELEADGGKFSKDLGQAEKQAGTFTGKVGKGFASAGKVAAVGLGVIAFGAKKAVDAASDMNETVSKTNTVFGKSGADMEKWGAAAAKNFGISKRDALDAASIFGTFGKAAGKTGDQLAEFSKPLVQAAADLASFHNVPVTQTLDDLRSGLAGETEPLRKYGILVNQAAIEQEALALGLVKATKNTQAIGDAQTKAGVAQDKYTAAVKAHGVASTEAKTALVSLHTAQNALTKATEGNVTPLSQENKMLATQQLVLKSLGPAAGDFARTSSGSANQARIQAAETANLTANLGKGLLPAYQLGQKILLAFTGFMAAHTKETKLAVAAIAGLAAVVLTVNAAVKVAAALQTAYTAAVAIGRAAMGLFAKQAVTATVAQEGLNTAQRLNPLGILLTAATAAAIGFGLLKRNTIDVTTATTEATTAAQAYKTALDQLKGSADSIKQAELGVEQAEVNLARARQNLATATKSGTTSQLDLKEANLAVKQAELGLTEAITSEKKAHEDAKSARTAAATSTSDLRTKMADLIAKYNEGKTALESLGADHSKTAKLAENFATALRGVAKDAGGSSTELGRAALAAANLAAKVEDIPDSKTIVVTMIENVNRTVREFLDPIINAGRAAGGPVRAGTPYVVGERGPEMFVPSVSGTIVPNVKGAAAGASQLPSGDVILRVNERELGRVAIAELLRAGKSTIALRLAGA